MRSWNINQAEATATIKEMLHQGNVAREWLTNITPRGCLIGRLSDNNKEKNVDGHEGEQTDL